MIATVPVDVAAHDAERLGERSFDDVDRCIWPSRSATRRRARRKGTPVDLVEIRSWGRSVRRDRRWRRSCRVAFHGIDGFEADILAEFGDAARKSSSNAPCRCGDRCASRRGVAHAFNHGGMIEIVGKEDAAGKQASERESVASFGRT